MGIRASGPPAPRHVAIIMDGNGRWARARNLPRPEGHRQGAAATRRVVEHCARRGVRVLTLFAFSSENWRRPPTEVRSLMELFLVTLRRESRRLAENGIRVCFIGDRSAFQPRLREEIEAAERLTAECVRMQLNIAANYGGRWDITQAARRLCGAVRAGELDPAQVDEAALAERLATQGVPDPDLFIRTGGEHRISNFLLWQLAYTELYFTDTLWPDFEAEDLEAAFADYASRQRRFGRTGEQLRSGDAGA